MSFGLAKRQTQLELFVRTFPNSLESRQGPRSDGESYGRAGHRQRLAQAAFRRAVPSRSPEKGRAPAPDTRPFPHAIEAPLWRPPSEKGKPMTKTLIQSDPRQFTGTEQWYTTKPNSAGSMA